MNSHETPEQKAARLGVPLIPKRIPAGKEVVAVCGKCGLELRPVMGYSCPKANCPAGLGSSVSMSPAKSVDVVHPGRPASISTIDN